MFAKGMRERGSVDPRFAERIPSVKAKAPMSRDEVLSRFGGKHYRNALKLDLHPVDQKAAKAKALAAIQPAPVKAAAPVHVPEERVRIVRGFPVRGKELEALEAREKKAAAWTQKGYGPGEGPVKGDDGKMGHWVQIGGHPVFIEEK